LRGGDRTERTQRKEGDEKGGGGKRGWRSGGGKQEGDLSEKFGKGKKKGFRGEPEEMYGHLWGERRFKRKGARSTEKERLRPEDIEGRHGFCRGGRGWENSREGLGPQGRRGGRRIP